MCCSTHSAGEGSAVIHVSGSRELSTTRLHCKVLMSSANELKEEIQVQGGEIVSLEEEIAKLNDDLNTSIDNEEKIFIRSQILSKEDQVLELTRQRLSMSIVLPRSQLVADLFDKVARGGSRIVYLQSPATTGKTSLLRLFQQSCGEMGVTCIYVSMLSEDFEGELKDKTGINAGRWRLEPDKNGDCVCADPSKNFVVLVDDVQKRYDHISFWASLIKPRFSLDLPGNIWFVFATADSLSMNLIPVYFESFPHLTYKDFRLSEEEVNEYLRLSSDRMKSERAGVLLVDPAVRAMIAANCNGHIGALSLSVTEIVKRFSHNPVVTVGDIVSFYLSRDSVACFVRCYSCEVVSLPEQMRTSLVRCLTKLQDTVPKHESPETYDKLVRAGVLEEFPNGAVEFAAPAAASYINHLLFPNRSEQMMDEVNQRGVFVLMKAVLPHMSASTLRKAVQYSTKIMPYDAIFHHMLLAGLHAQTPEGCFIVPALSKYFPLPLLPGHGPKMVEGAATAILPSVKGRCDYYLGGALQWVIEVLFIGDSGSAGEPLSRLESDSEGKYVGLAYTDHLIVDIRVSATGEPTLVQRNERRMSVFFKQGDFSYCNVLCGRTELAERITLAE